VRKIRRAALRAKIKILQAAQLEKRCSVKIFAGGFGQ